MLAYFQWLEDIRNW